MDFLSATTLAITKASKFLRVGCTATLDRLRPVSPPPVLVDIGARGGLQNKWRLYSAIAPLIAIFVEPDATEAARLRQASPRARVLPVALGDAAGAQLLHMTSEPGCSSFLRPTRRALDSGIGWRLQPAGSIEVQVERADAVFARDDLPAPDFLKIDTQGTELAVLRGFGALLQSACAIELECELIALYESQPLLCDVVAFLDEAGFGLAAMRPRPPFDGGIWDVDAYFTRRPAGLSQRQRRLIATWRAVNRIPGDLAYAIAAG